MYPRASWGGGGLGGPQTPALFRGSITYIISKGSIPILLGWGVVDLFCHWEKMCDLLFDY